MTNPFKDQILSIVSRPKQASPSKCRYGAAFPIFLEGEKNDV
jgi:hypothetical protein